jgi:hypothetical protein
MKVETREFIARLQKVIDSELLELHDSDSFFDTSITALNFSSLLSDEHVFIAMSTYIIDASKKFR